MNQLCLDLPAPATVTVVGDITFHPRGRGEWILRAQPHIMIRLRRLFPRATVIDGALVVTHNSEMCRDIDWVRQRWDFHITGAHERTLTEGAREHRATETTAAQILAGHPIPTRERAEPARTPRPYQQQAADLFTVVRRCLLTDWLGLGKTMTGTLIYGDPTALPAVFVTLTALPEQMRREINASWPNLNVHIVTKRTPYPLNCRPDVIIISYSKLSGWQHDLCGWARSVIFDEVQELRRSGTDKYLAAKTIADHADWVLGLTATPVYNYAGELHAIYDVIAPGFLGDRDEFIREWAGRVWEHPGSNSRHIAVKDPHALSLYLRQSGRMIGRTRAEVGRELPYGEPEKIVHVIDADPKVLDAMAGDAVEMAKVILSGSARSWQAAGELDARLRQATGIAKAPYVARFVNLLLESEERVVLFGWHHAVYDVWMHALHEHRPVLYTGAQSTTGKNTALEQFMTGCSRVLIMSLRSGAGVDGLQGHAKVAVFGELDWSPKVLEQCLGRLARDGQENQVLGYYLVAEDGADPVMADTLELKSQQSTPIENPHSAAVNVLPPAGDRVRLLAEHIIATRT